MIRDMESQLNDIKNPQIREYMYEAFECYSIGAYRASVLMSTIGGINDLHIKVKNLSPSNKNIAKLEAEISRLKNELKPYERFLIEKCATPDIDLLCPNEAKALLRCFDIRNDCAHASDFNCTPEVAREVFTTMIDILASKPILLGLNYIPEIVNKISGDLFFPRIDSKEIKDIVYSKMSTFSPKLYLPLARRLVKEIISNQFSNNNNKHFFLSYMANFISREFDKIIEPLLIESNNQNHFMIMLYINNELVNYLSHDNIKRLLVIFPNYLWGNNYYVCNSTIRNVLLSETLNKSIYDQNIAWCVNYGYQNMEEQQCNLWIEIMSKIDKGSSRFLSIIEDYKSNTLNKISFKSQLFQKIFSICDNSELYHNFILELTNSIANADYTISNPATDILKQLDKDFICHLNDDDIKKIVYSIIKGSDGYGRNVIALFENLDTQEYFKVYVQKCVNEFNMDELKLLLSYYATDNSLLKFFNLIFRYVPDFTSTVMQVLTNYLDNEPYDDYNHNVVTNLRIHIEGNK